MPSQWQRSKGVRAIGEYKTTMMVSMREEGKSWGWIARHFKLDKSNVKKRINKRISKI